jgi:hypothetical protein
MKSRPTVYPDISDILARKAAGRRRLAALSFGEKLDLLDAMRERVQPMRAARKSRGRADAVKSPRKAAKK